MKRKHSKTLEQIYRHPTSSNISWADIEYGSELDQFRGEILGLNSSSDFYGKCSSVLRKEFKKSLRVFLEVCEENGISPMKEFSGKFNLRISPKLHGKIAAVVTGENKSINQWVSETLEQNVGR